MMSRYPEPGPDNDPEPLQGRLPLPNMNARLPEEVGPGVFANNVLILTGPHEVVLDFAQRLSEPHRIVARVILPHTVARQFVSVLQENLKNYETRFGHPALPKPRPLEHTETPPAQPPLGQSIDFASADREREPWQSDPAAEDHPENRPAPPAVPPSVEDVYSELRLSDQMLSGRYANAVLVRHFTTEFCFDFITNIYPRSGVSSRVYMTAAQVPPFLSSLVRSFSPPSSPPPPMN